MEKNGLRFSVGVFVIVAFVAGFFARGLTSPAGHKDETSADNAESGPRGIAQTPEAEAKQKPSTAAVIRGYQNRVITSEPARQFSMALRETNDLERFRKVAEALAMMDAEDAEEAIDVFQQHHHDGRRFTREVRDLMRRLGQIAGADALKDRNYEGPGTPDRSEWRYIMSGWASKNPTEAKGWLENLEEGEFKNQMTRGLIEGMAQNNVDQAADYMASLPLNQQLRNLDAMTWHQLQDGGYLKLGNWADSLPQGTAEEPLTTDQAEYGRRVFSRVANRMLEQDTATAADWIEQRTDSPHITGESIRRVASRMGSEDNETALDWAWNLPTERIEIVSPAIADSITNWAANDINAAGSWLGVQDRSSPLYDEAARSYVRTVAKVNMDAAEQWAETIQSPEIRAQVLEELRDTPDLAIE